MSLSEEEIKEIQEQKKIDRAEDDRDHGSDDYGFEDCWMDKYEENLGWV